MTQPPEVPGEVAEVVATRTPGFAGWQQERWLYHWADAAAFLGVIGRAQLEPHPDALEVLRHEHDGYRWTPDEVERYLADLDRSSPASAYLFRCLHCGTHLAYSDFT